MLYWWFETKRCLHLRGEDERLCFWCLDRGWSASLFSILDPAQLLTIVQKLYFSQTLLNFLPDLLSRNSHAYSVFYQRGIDEWQQVFSRDGLNVHASHDHPAVEVIPNLNSPCDESEDYWVRPFVYSSASHSQISPRVSMGTAVSGSSRISMKRSRLSGIMDWPSRRCSSCAWTPSLAASDAVNETSRLPGIVPRAWNFSVVSIHSPSSPLRSKTNWKSNGT